MRNRKSFKKSLSALIMIVVDQRRLMLILVFSSLTFISQPHLGSTIDFIG